jgi:hypothetical protein
LAAGDLAIDSAEMRRRNLISAAEMPYKLPRLEPGPVHVATWIEAATREFAAPSVKQRLAAIRHLSTGSSPARWCRSTRQRRCGGPGTW